MWMISSKKRQNIQKSENDYFEKIKLENSFKLLKDGLNDNIVEYKLLNELQKFAKLLYKGKNIQSDKKCLIHFYKYFCLTKRIQRQIEYSIVGNFRIYCNRTVSKVNIQNGLEKYFTSL